jgi:hypothetical protein
MLTVDDVRKAAAAFTQDMKENSMEDGFGGSSPRRVRGCHFFTWRCPHSFHASIRQRGSPQKGPVRASILSLA